MAKLQKYQLNSIKTIYGHKTYIDNDDATDEDIENFYQENMNFNNSIEIPDMLKNMCGAHALSKYYITGERTDNEDTRIAINNEIANNVKYCYKLLREKEIHWENAYLPNLTNEGFNIKEIKYNKFNVDINARPVTISKEQITDTTFENYNDTIPDKIINTYDLLKIVDYLLLRFKVLYFLLNKIKEQKKEISTYKTYRDNSNNTN